MFSNRTEVETADARASSRRVGGHYSFVLLLLLVLCADLMSGVRAECTVINDKTNEQYDLQGLTRESGDWEVEGQYAGHNFTFYLNVCHKVVHESDLHNAIRQSMGVYMLSASSAQGKSLGEYDKPYLQGEKLVLNYKHGTSCHNNVNHATIIAFTCDSGAAQNNGPVFLGATNDCGYFFEWHTPFACPTKLKGDDKSGWGVFFTILAIAILVYIIGGIMYNRMVYNATGISQLPNAEFWGNAWDFVKDMPLMLIYQLPCFKPAVHMRSYRNVPHDEEALIDTDLDER